MDQWGRGGVSIYVNNVKQPGGECESAVLGRMEVFWAFLGQKRPKNAEKVTF
jgi:hypothetical protein